MVQRAEISKLSLEIMKNFFSKPQGSLFICLCFIVPCLFILVLPGTEDKSSLVIALLIFSVCAGIFLWEILRSSSSPLVNSFKPKVKPPSFNIASSIDEIEVERREVEDDEDLEEWVRVGENLHTSFQMVAAGKTDSEEFAWGVGIWAGEFLHRGVIAEDLNNEIFSALSAVPGVKTVGQEDNEQWAIDGDCNGKALVQAAAFAIDRVLERHEESILE